MMEGASGRTLIHQGVMSMTSVTIEEAQATLPELIGKMVAGEELEITQGEEVVAILVAERPHGRRPGPGLGAGMLTVVAEDDEHLQGFPGFVS
jgi:antitoxin (DNA-binding transcriptional repressor) of toxin-antitoxin stability system